MTKGELVALAKAKIDGHACTGSYAQDAEGRDVHPTSEHAVCFCAIGALVAVSPVGVIPVVEDWFPYMVGDFDTYVEGGGDPVAFFDTLDYDPDSEFEF